MLTAGAFIHEYTGVVIAALGNEPRHANRPFVMVAFGALVGIIARRQSLPHRRGQPPYPSNENDQSNPVN